jgi:hypothetical protein
MLTFIVVPVLLAIGLVWGAPVGWRRSGGAAASVRVSLVTAAASAAWMAMTWVAAETGLLRRWDLFPPPFGLLVLAIVVIGVAVAFSGFGRRLAHFVPLWALVGVQAFRLPLELSMHRLAERGIMPPQMTYTGRNFDIVTGATAIVVAWLAARGVAGRPLVFAWNVLGLCLLVNVVTIAVLSTPAIRYFGDANLNVFVTYTPYVWLPAVMVLAAWAGHLIIFRALRRF